ncbi:MAG: class I SAM-dependent methyltransferase [Chloroflexi bacterium]|nr:class I SAM-dependent methyltransferase [Chloroflexota bacterium]MCC6892506.1 class I SAM-dependent methyltransferase [Anaerolineae bacterium]
MTTPNPEYLKNQQYGDSTRLQARARLHSHYSRNPYNWYKWQFDHYVLPPDAKVLEIGAGAGWLWMNNADRIPAGWEITLSDFSPGMVAELRENTRDIAHRFNFEEIDVQQIPHEDQTFDSIIANHMLYHVPDRSKAIAELRRVLKSGGKLFTATNGDHHLQELHRVMAQLNIQQEQYLGGFAGVRGYTLENATDQLRSAFEHVELHHYDDEINIPSAQPLIDYIHSFPVEFDAAHEQQVHAIVDAEVHEKGTFKITKDMGVLIAY